MSLDITKSVTLNGKSLEGTTSQGQMSASITKGQSLNMNIYLNAPENLDMVSARTDVVQFVAQVFANAMQVAPPKKNTSTSTGATADKSSSSSSSSSSAPKADTGSDSKETTPSTSGSEKAK